MLEPGAPVWRLAFWLCILAVLIVSLLPGDALPPLETGWDKANHALAYTVLGLFGLAAYPGRVATVLAALVMYGALIEILQGATGYRYAEWADLLADVLGLALAGLVVLAARLARWKRTVGAPKPDRR